VYRYLSSVTTAQGAAADHFLTDVSPLRFISAVSTFAITVKLIHIDYICYLGFCFPRADQKHVGVLGLNVEDQSSGSIKSTMIVYSNKVR